MTGDGAWLTSKAYVTGTADGVTGYVPATGKELWSIPLSGRICAASRTQTTAGYVAVAYAEGRDVDSRCTDVAVIDLNKGTASWQATLPKGTTKGLRMSVAVSGDTVAVGWPGEELRGESVGYRISTGKKLWSAPPSGCALEEQAGGAELVTISVCGRDSEIGKRDPETGKLSWRSTAPKGTTDAWIVSASPLVVALNTDQTGYQSGADRLVSLSEGGCVQATWETHEEDPKTKRARYVAGCGYTQPGCGAVVVSDSTLYMATLADVSDANKIIAFDVKTGKEKWSYKP
ncbi:PQQ-binding-like beta-propeller repeat protein [Streptomyces niveus]|uniref:outer membrane protein assembly factor BamB family protein n=1 Tax=Streptomyces niveus TaxID=193462 RepID=UPI00340410C4